MRDSDFLPRHAGALFWAIWVGWLIAGLISAPAFAALGMCSRGCLAFGGGYAAFLVGVGVAGSISPLFKWRLLNFWGFLAASVVWGAIAVVFVVLFGNEVWRQRWVLIIPHSMFTFVLVWLLFVLFKYWRVDR